MPARGRYRPILEADTDIIQGIKTFILIRGTGQYTMEHMFKSHWTNGKASQTV